MVRVDVGCRSPVSENVVKRVADPGGTWKFAGVSAYANVLWPWKS